MILFCLAFMVYSFAIDKPIQLEIVYTLSGWCYVWHYTGIERIFTPYDITGHTMYSMLCTKVDEMIYIFMPEKHSIHYYLSPSRSLAENVTIAHNECATQFEWEWEHELRGNKGGKSMKIYIFRWSKTTPTTYSNEQQIFHMKTILLYINR